MKLRDLTIEEQQISHLILNADYTQCFLIPVKVNGVDTVAVAVEHEGQISPICIAATKEIFAITEFPKSIEIDGNTDGNRKT